MCEHKQIIYTSLNLNIIFAKIKESLENVSANMVYDLLLEIVPKSGKIFKIYMWGKLKTYLNC